jgi:hypothetical protein
MNRLVQWALIGLAAAIALWVIVGALKPTASPSAVEALDLHSPDLPSESPSSGGAPRETGRQDAARPDGDDVDAVLIGDADDGRGSGVSGTNTLDARWRGGADRPVRAAQDRVRGADDRVRGGDHRTRDEDDDRARGQDDGDRGDDDGDRGDDD